MILTASLFNSGKPAQYKYYKGFMVLVTAIQPCHVPRLNLVKNILNVQIKTTIFVFQTDQLFQKPKHQFIVAWSFYVENSLINIIFEVL